MRYESDLSIFSPDGRLLQVERAMLASDQGSLVVFTKENDHILIAIEKRMSKNIIDDPKLFVINPSNVYISYSGLSPDGTSLINDARLIYRRYMLNNSENISVRLLAKRLSEVMMLNTVVKSKRPYGVRMVILGLDPEPRIFIVEPDGNYAEYEKGAIGNRNKEVFDYFEKSDGCAMRGIFEAVSGSASKVEVYKLYDNRMEKVDDKVVEEFAAKMSSSSSEK